eukprot:TRINITY_DN9187_c1_g1_i1.p1 TRINITY_DN9187_c1_g1~~TRINITY_DN9187_c1_g1_i1.p1  ORF type:complete len:295 (+),score=70.52 TRINITY_DN9187_c1_g1_i1:51-887(+)
MGASCAASEYPIGCGQTLPCKEDTCVAPGYAPARLAPDSNVRDEDVAVQLLVAQLELMAEDRCFTVDAQADVLVVKAVPAVAKGQQAVMSGASCWRLDLLDSLAALPSRAFLARVAAMAGAAAAKDLSLTCRALSTAISESAADIASLGGHDFEDQYFPFMMTASPMDILAATIRFLFNHVCVNAKAFLGCKEFPIFSSGFVDSTDSVMLDAALIEDVAVFVYKILESGRFAKAELIVGTMYLLRFLDKAEVLMHPTNWRQLFSSALCLADAYLEDRS